MLAHTLCVGGLVITDRIITSPAGTVAKYCDKYVCVSVSLRGYGVFFLIDNALYSRAFETHTKTKDTHIQTDHATPCVAIGRYHKLSLRCGLITII